MMPYYAILRADSPDRRDERSRSTTRTVSATHWGRTSTTRTAAESMLWPEDFDEIAVKGYASRPERVIEEKDGRERRESLAKRCRFR